MSRRRASLRCLCGFAIGVVTVVGVAACAGSSAAGSTAGHESAPGSAAGATAGSGSVERGGVPLLAAYSIGIDADSWRSAEGDAPRIGRYTSDDAAALREQIVQAKSAGIQGFMVSWQGSVANDRRLHLLIEQARQHDFLLALRYESFDDGGRPESVRKVATDLATFQEEFSAEPVFLRLGGKVLTVWAGTWAFSHAEVDQVAASVRNGLLVLNTEQSVEGYQRIADVTDGVAYGSPGGAELKSDAAALARFSSSVHGRGQYWLAPVVADVRSAPVTVRAEYAAAVRSSPDVLVAFSWNDYAHNSYLEPSKQFGARSLSTLRSLRGAQVPVPAAAEDSSDPTGAGSGAVADDGNLRTVLSRNLVLLIGFVLVLIVGGGIAGIILRRGERSRRLKVARARRRADDPPPAAPLSEHVHVEW